MNDIQHNDEQAADLEATADTQDAPQVEDTPLENPLDQSTRALVARWLTEIAGVFEEDLDTGPTDQELREFDVNAEEWAQRNRDAIERLHSTARRISEDPLPFSVAGEARNLLQSAEDHKLIAASAALEATITAALPERLEVYGRAVEQQKAQRGFHIQIVGGRDEPLPLPSFAYTDGLAERTGHPELVIVATPPHVAGTLLHDLGSQILAGQRTVRAGENLEGLLTGGYKLRVVACPAALADQVRHRDQPTEVLQILIPDPAGRFAGDPDVDPNYGDAQQYPDYPA
jgi:Domain of unknown function (DUF4262)